jgi:hypothetical protein
VSYGAHGGWREPMGVFATDADGRTVRADAIGTERWARAGHIVGITRRVARLAIWCAPLLDDSIHACELAHQQAHQEAHPKEDEERSRVAISRRETHPG